jgi:O-antigen/teichoic acid export membrane protein
LFKRIVSVLGANIFGQICTVLIQFLGVPIFLTFWGQDFYGEWLMIIAIPSYLMVTGTGVGFVSGNKLQMLIANNKEEEATVVFQSAWTMICALSIAVLLIVIPVVLLSPIHEWLNIKYNTAFEVKAALIILSLYMFSSLLSEVLTAVYRATGRFARGIFTTNLLRIVEFLGIIISVILGAKIIIAALIYLLVRIAGILWMVYECSKLSWFHISLARASFSEMKSEFTAIVSFLGVPMSQALLIQGMTTIVGIRLGASAVVVFTITRTLINVIKQFASIIYSAILPEFSVSISTGDLHKARLLHRFSFQITLWFAITSSLLLFLFSDWIMFIWTGGKINLEKGFFLLMLVVTIPYTLSTVSSFVPVSINKFSRLAFTSLFNAVMCITLTYLLAPYFGLISVPLTLLLAEIIMFYIVVRQSLMILKDSFRDFAADIFFTLPFKKIFEFRKHFILK